jgi:Zn-dependent protease
LNIDPVAAAIGFGVLLLSLTIHEAAHAWTADKLGDPTARMLGRVSLNPLVHIDWIGTVLLPIIAAISRLPLIGWAKPVPVNLRNLRHPRRDFMIVAAAGPISNFLQAFVAAAVLRMIWDGTVGDGGPGVAVTFLYIAVQVNLLLAFFNLIPIPPLDGSHVMYHLLPPHLGMRYREVGRYGMFILLGLMIFARPLFSMLLLPVNVLIGLAQSFILLWT